MSQDDIVYLREKVDKLVDGQNQTNVHLAEYNTSLREHMRRTLNLESRADSFDLRLKPIEKRADGLHFLVKVALASIPLLGLLHALHVL